MTAYLLKPVPFLQAFLSNDDLGDSLDSVEALIKKHEDFEKSLAAQEEKIKALNEFATKLIEGQHYAAEDVTQRRDAVRGLFQPCFNPIISHYACTL